MTILGILELKLHRHPDGRLVRVLFNGESNCEFVLTQWNAPNALDRILGGWIESNVCPANVLDAYADFSLHTKLCIEKTVRQVEQRTYVLWTESND